MNIKLAVSLPTKMEISMYSSPGQFYDKFDEYLQELQQKGIAIVKVTNEKDFHLYNLDGTPSYSLWTQKTNKWKLLNTLGPELDELKQELNSIVGLEH